MLSEREIEYIANRVSENIVKFLRKRECGCSNKEEQTEKKEKKTQQGKNQPIVGVPDGNKVKPTQVDPSQESRNKYTPRDTNTIISNPYDD